mmetsp:Transcript_87742/g.175513  ORF Transcript_87742/g.175513 Transcript_87742/m.175513 type:complete len:215 (-) Transcript_87742:628-1272(-)
MDELPCAMLAKGPACTSTGVRSTVCMRVGMMASFIKTVSAPPMPRSSAVTVSPALERATTMRPSRSRMSSKLVVSASTAMISEATAMSKPVVRVAGVGRSRFPFGPFGSVTSSAPSPILMPRRNRSQVSSTRFQVMVDGSMSKRANADFSSLVSSSGVVLWMPSFFSLRSMTGQNLLPASVTSRRNKASSDCTNSWYMRVSMAADKRLLAATMA